MEIKAHEIIEFVLTKVATYHELKWRDVVVNRNKKTIQAKLIAIHLLKHPIERELLADIFHVNTKTINEYISKAHNQYYQNPVFTSIVQQIQYDLHDLINKRKTYTFTETV